MTNRFSWAVLLAVAIFASCKKNSNKNGGGNQEDLTKTEVLKETRDNYLWYDQIPDTFNPQSYKGPSEIMDAIREYSKEPGFSDPVDHYSFAIKKTEWDSISQGVTTDFGLNAFFLSDGDLRVRSVEKLSPAGLAGVRRGWKFIKVAGSSSITTSNADFLVKSIYNSSQTDFTFQLPDGSTRNLSLAASTYQEQPIYLDTIYTEGSKKVGYVVFNSFLGQVSNVSTSFAILFNKFVANDVTDMIVDLRYNGGGYVSLQQTLANYLVNSSANGSVMMNEEFNDKHSANNETFNFEKLGNLNINNIYFLVGDNTASASELLINNLKPYMNVKLVGNPTYGKPVGFFDIQVGDWLIFPVSFRSTNALDEGNYFDGIPVDKEAADGLDKDWGDREETSLATALTHIRTGSFGFVPKGEALNSTLESDIKSVNSKLSPKTFKGAIK